MEYKKVIRDFAERTRINLTHIEEALSNGADVYEVTQLVNSLLGLLVFPKERYYNSIPQTPLEELHKQGWPKIEVVGDFKPAEDLREQVRYLRNAIAHFNIEFIADMNGQLSGISVWNENHGELSWKANIPLDDLHVIVNKFIDLILDEMPK